MRDKNNEDFKKTNRNLTVTDFLIGIVSFILGAGMVTVSSLLLVQSLLNHKGEIGPHYLQHQIYEKPFKNSNWMKTSIPTIVVSSVGILVGTVQILASLVLIFVNGKLKILGVVIWVGSHMLIFILNIVIFSIAVSVKAHEVKNSLEEVNFDLDYNYYNYEDYVENNDTKSTVYTSNSALFWQNYMFRSRIVNNPEGHAFCSLIAVNSIFILVAVSITTPKLYQAAFGEFRPIYLPQSAY